MTMGSKAKILIVDDVASNRKLLADLVVMEGCEAFIASGGVEALAIIARQDIDVVLLDMMMPDFDGISVLREMKVLGLLPTIPVVVVSALEDRQLRVQALASGAIDFISKPIDRAEVGCKIRTLVELKKLREGAVRSVQDELRAAENRLQLRFEQSPVAEIEWDVNCCVANWNPAAEAIFGYTHAEALGRHVSFIVPEDQHARIDEDWCYPYAGPKKSTRTNVTHTGAKVVCDWHDAPLRVGDGTALGVSSIVIDVSQRELLQQALVQSSKMDAIGKLAGGIAHDFNNILAVILSYASFIRDELPTGDPKRDDIIEVLKAADRAAGLTKQLLTFSRQQPSAKRRVDLNESLIQINKLLSRSVGAQISLGLRPADESVIVNIDPVQFDQLVLNLAINARDAMPNGGRLDIELARVGSADLPADAPADRVLLTVKDTGTGMDAETQRRIFEPFFTTKEKDKGTGLGLATSFGIIVDAGGSIRVDSKLGEGTTFFVELPLSGGAAETSPIKAIPREALGETILVAEDESGLRGVASRVLRNAGYEVYLASDGIEAIERINELGDKLDLVLTDVVMPGCNGHDVAAHAAKTIPRAAVIVMSGYFENAGKERNPSDHSILWKPMSPAELLSAVAETLHIKNKVAAPTPAPATEHLVLLVDDDETILKALTRIMKQAGYATATASTVASARAMLEDGTDPWLVLCDLSLPDGSGSELLRWLRDTRPTLASRLFILSGGAVDEADVRLVESNEFQVLSKPIDAKRLLLLLAASQD